MLENEKNQYKDVNLFKETTKMRKYNKILSLLMTVLLIYLSTIGIYADSVLISEKGYFNAVEFANIGEELSPMSANGCNNKTVYSSKNLYGYDVRMDVEQGGSGLVNIHVHCNGVKYTYDFSSETYIAANGNTLPNKVANSSEIGSAFDKAMYYYNAWS